MNLSSLSLAGPLKLSTHVSFSNTYYTRALMYFAKLESNQDNRVTIKFTLVGTGSKCLRTVYYYYYYFVATRNA